MALRHVGSELDAARGSRAVASWGRLAAFGIFGLLLVGAAPSPTRALCSGGAPNGVGNPGEQCDDGNSVNADGCSNTCVENPGYACSCPAGQLTGVTVDDPQTLLAVIGGAGGGPFADRCPVGQVTVGFEYTIGPYIGPHQWVTASRARCASLSVSGSAVTITPAGFTPSHGGGAGTVNALSCPSGHVVAGFIGDARTDGTFVGIAGAQLYCAPLIVGASGRVVVGAAVPGPSARPGGGAITVVGPSLCPAGSVVSGNQGRSGTIIDQFTMLCQEVYTNCGAPMTCSGICGDGLVRGAETCDDTNIVSGDGCSATCLTETGYACMGSGPGTCAPICGDAMLRGGETCDDGNVAPMDGCSATCAVEAGYVCPGVGPGSCAAVCGDALLRGSETCDDGNVAPMDGCSATCAVEGGYACSGTGPGSCAAICGDGVVLGGETCDDGGVVAGDGCSATCVVEGGFVCPIPGAACVAVCGDGLLRGAETCDDGNMTSLDGCSSVCAVESGYVCMGTGPGSCGPICGDGVVLGDEACDDANLVPDDGCSATCAIETGYACTGMGQGSCVPICGDDVVVGDEPCDDGNVASGDGCSATCEVEPGYVCTGMGAESCTPICGDATAVGAETCDDGNDAAGDGCSSTCLVETGYACTGVGAGSCAPVCGDGRVVGVEACDDGDVDDADGCSSTCTIEPGFECTGTMPSVCIECVADDECGASEFCDTQANRCVDKYTNGTMLPTIADHDPVLDGTCTEAVGLAVCLAGACDILDDACGLLNGTAGCASDATAVCRSGVCGADMACGYADGEGPCTAVSGETVCRSGACSVDGTCRAAAGCNVDGDCDAAQFCDTEAHLCVSRLTNGTPIPTIADHDPVLDGTCSAAVGDAVCEQRVCEPGDDRCGLMNGSDCEAASDATCRSGVCFDADGLCGLPVGEACVLAIVCRSNVCSSEGTCGDCTTDADCGGASSGRVCHDGTKRCVDGCRGEGGNGCPSGEACSSLDTTVGVCAVILPDGGVDDGGIEDAGVDDAEVPDARIDATADGDVEHDAGEGLSGGAMCSASTPDAAGSRHAAWVVALVAALACARRRGQSSSRRKAFSRA